MSRIFKYPLEVESRQLLTMPPGAKILCLEVQNESPVLYAEVEPEREGFEQRVFRTVTTGEVFNAKESDYVGTVMLNDWYACHVYEQPTANAEPDPIQDRFLDDMDQIREELKFN